MSLEVSLQDKTPNLQACKGEWESRHCPSSWVSQVTAVLLRGTNGLNVTMNVRILKHYTKSI